MNKTLYIEALALTLESEHGRIALEEILRQLRLAVPISPGDNGAVALANASLRLASDMAEANPGQAVPLIASFYTGGALNGR